MAADGAEDTTPFLFAVAGMLLFIAIAFGAAAIFSIPLADAFSWSVRDAVIGVVATAPPAAFLFWVMRTERPVIVAFRRSQVEYFANIGFAFTPLRIVILSVSAGVSEELLFRGVIQGGLDLIAPMLVALVVASAIFGMLHWRTALYALIAGVLGLWLGILYIATGNLLAPIITHALYDFVAFIVTARAVADWNADKMQNDIPTED